ncbi:site-specific integrase [Nocardia spumae]|uniref:site-specific integrase n=1 Tax=Nocardia spumae TaxID=2887190 RepID=UPI001D1575B6|nr:site-specific integrase [Nocardia spumae]
MSASPDPVVVDIAVPDVVRTELRRGVRSVLVDTVALRMVRERFDAEQAAALSRYLEASQSPNTVRAYRSDWIAWSAWCAAEARCALPADALDVAVYLAAAADARKPSGDWAFGPATLERKSAAIAAVHAANGLPSPTRSDVVRLTLRGIRRTRRSVPNRKRPVLLHTLEQLLDGLPAPGWPTEPARRRDRLLLLVGFAGALRRSELAGLRIGDVVVALDHRTGEPVLLVRLPATKTDPTGAAAHSVALPRGVRPATCPVCAFADWIALRDIHSDGGTNALRAWIAETAADASADIHRCHGFTGATTRANPHDALFPPVSRHGGIGANPISGRAVAELVKRYAARAGLDPALFSGHSLRAGFATQAALGGASDREIMRQGRWSNPRTVHSYIRTANPLEDNAVTKLGL